MKNLCLCPIPIISGIGQRLIFALFIFGVVSPAMPAPGDKVSRRDPVPASLGDLRGQIDRAVLVIAPRPGVWSFNRPLAEEDLQNLGCTYELSDPASISSLIEIILKAQFSDDPDPEYYGVFMGIYLYTRENSLTSLVFRNVRGRINGHRVTVDGSFEKEIRALVAKLAPKIIHYTCEGEPPENIFRRFPATQSE